MAEPFDRVDAPFTAKQVMALNEFQKLGKFFPFTCRQRDDHVDNSILVASESGWRCPNPGCGYTQSWAYAFMADKDSHPKKPKFLEGR